MAVQLVVHRRHARRASGFGRRTNDVLQEIAGLHCPSEALFTIPGQQRHGADLAQIHADVVFETIALGARRNGRGWLDLLGHFDLGQGSRMRPGHPGRGQYGGVLDHLW